MMKRRVVMMLGLCLFVSAAWSSNKAGVVIQNSTGETITRCVQFEESGISVEELLNRSGFTMASETSAEGTTLRYLHDDGVLDGTAHTEGWVWNLFSLENGVWIGAANDISTIQVTNGSMYGFAFGPVGGVEMPERTFAEVCEIISKAGLVIDHSTGERIVRVVEFFGETITGLQLLLQSDIPLVANQYSFGTAICAIDNEGQPSDDCFGDAEGRYWGFNVLMPDNTWESSWVGAADTIVRNTDIHGYLFGGWGSIQPPIQRQEVFELPSGVDFWGTYWN